MVYSCPENNYFLCKIYLELAKPYIRLLCYKTVCGIKLFSCYVQLESLILQSVFSIKSYRKYSVAPGRI